MLSIGGLNASLVDSWATIDAHSPQGLALFDLSEWRWAAGYDANAAPYERADGIQELYIMRKYFLRFAKREM